MSVATQNDRSVAPCFVASQPVDRQPARWALTLALLLGAAPLPHAAARPASHMPRSRTRFAAQASVLSAAFIKPGAGGDLGARVVSFARAHAGQQVGDGECYDLADEALQRAGARSASSYAAITEGADYVWGQPVALKDARPGDVLQFRDFTVTTTVTTNRQQTWGEDQRPHHTAIVEQNLGGVLSVFEQNAPPNGREVQINRVPITATTVQGAANDGSGFATTEIRVDGDVRAYRPQPL